MRRGARTAVPGVLVAVCAVAAPALLPGTAVAAPSREDTTCRSAPEKGVKLPESLPGRQLSERLGLTQAWDLADGEGVKVGVVDSGVDHRHPGLKGSVETGSELVMVATKKEFREQAPKAPALDCEGHGTAVAGILAAHRDGRNRIGGVAPGARVHPVRVADGVERASANTLAAAIDSAVEAEVKVLNLSFALPVDRAPVRKAVARAVAADVVVVAAAGNEGLKGRKMYPGAYDGVLAVGAVGEDGQPLDESNQGGWVDLAAYGEREIVLASGGSGYRQEKGTSFAAPQVAGAAALVRSRFPELSAPRVAQRLRDSAAPVGGGGDPRTGAGVVDPFGALTHLGAGGSGEGGEDAGEREAGAIPVQAVPREEPMLSATGAAAVAWSGGLLLAVLLALLGAPAFGRAASRGWRPGARGAPGAGGTRQRRGRAEPGAACPPGEVLERLTGPPPVSAAERTAPRPARQGPGAPGQQHAHAGRSAPAGRPGRPERPSPNGPPRRTRAADRTNRTDRTT